FDLAFLDQLSDQLSMVYHFEVPTKLRVLVFDRVEAVREGRYNLFELEGFFIAVQSLNILFGHHLVKVFVTDAPGRVAGTGFFWHQIAPHINNFWHMLDKDRTFSHTGPAGGASPKFVLGNHTLDQRRQFARLQAAISSPFF